MPQDVGRKEMSMKRIAVALVLVIGFAAVSACGTDQGVQKT
jgi:hypothetical protein